MTAIPRFGRYLKQIPRKTWVGLVVWVILFGLYGLTAARTMTGFGDSDELIVAGFTGSLSHPPGYPLLTGLIAVATHVPGIPPAVGAHLLASLIMATAVWLLYRIVVEIPLSDTDQHDSWYLITSACLTLLVGTTGLLWEHGTHIEVFGLNALLSLWFLYLTLTRPGLLWAIVGGVGLSHHQTFVLIWFPLVLWSVWFRKQLRSRWLPSILFTVLGFALGYSLLMVFGAHTTDYSWKFTPTLEGIWQFYSRADYSGYSPELGQLSAWWSGISLHKTIEALGFYLVELWTHWSVFGVLGVVGLAMGWKQISRTYIPLLFGWLAAGPFLAGYLTLLDGIPGSIDYETSRAIVERMYVLSDVWWGVWTVLGGLFLLRLLRITWRPVGTIVLGVLIVVWVGIRFPSHNLSLYRAAAFYTFELLDNLPPNTRLICLSDISCFGTTFIQALFNGRNDVVVVSSAAQFRSTYIQRQSDLFRFVYPDNPHRIGELVGWSTYQGIPVAVAQLNAYWATELGFNGEAFRLTPLPYSLAIGRESLGVVPSYKPVYAATQLLLKTPLRYRYVRVLRAVLTEHHALAANLLRRMDNRDFAKRELTAGLLLSPTNQILLSMQQTIDSDPPDPSYQVKLTNEGYEVRIRDCRDRKDVHCALTQSRWFAYRNPDDVLARIELARSFEAVRQLPFAKREYQHVLELDPQNQEALTATSRLKGVIDLGNTLF